MEKAKPVVVVSNEVASKEVVPNEVSRIKRTIMGQTVAWISPDKKHVVDYKFRTKFSNESDLDYKLFVHGIVQKIGDAAAKKRDAATGLSHPIALKFAAMKRVRDNLVAGVWNEKREPSVDVTAELLFATLVKYYGPKRSEAKIRAYLDGLNEVQTLAIKVDPKFKPIYDKLLAEFVAEVDVDAMLDEMEDM